MIQTVIKAEWETGDLTGWELEAQEAEDSGFAVVIGIRHNALMTASSMSLDMKAARSLYEFLKPIVEREE